jgi:tetratricopeptide (TPR) repeat protein
MTTYRKVVEWRDTLNAAEAASKELQVTDAEMLYQNALTMAKSGLEMQEVLTTLIHLADFYARHQQHDQAEPLYKEALALYEKQFGTSNFISAMCLRSLSETLAAQGKMDEATEVKMRSADILSSLSTRKQ